ncbi:MAG TPA: ACT domain-containing protein [Coriobacteriia bacterium]|jgi:glycine cleavage system transcriptional repressor
MMAAQIVFTLTGPDRVGLVDEVTELLLDLGGNVETSRMMRLGGEFAMLMLVSLPDVELAKLDASLAHLTGAGYKVTASRTEERPDEHAGWLPYRIEVMGADHEGIIHRIAHGLSRRGINIESAETETKQAPVSATPLFSMTTLVLVPPELAEPDWRVELEEAAQRANVDVTVKPEGRE